ncbi:hypothetical protein E8L90_20125 [Brevibacillus antibioticus]|uniref:Uncharacterized protein n=1 Tax=Brevibacillus antibioticus TaxID=2570228 RepID=A0A4U2YA30_9BACL|nr:hypothetical protein E8L90_20125 [Brevibacillus antibioticus]
MQISPGKNDNFHPMYLPNLLLYPLAVLDFVLFNKLVRVQQPQIRFMYLRSGLCRRLPSDSTSRWTHLPWANGWYSQPPFETYTLELSPMLGALKKAEASASAQLTLLFGSHVRPPFCLRSTASPAD